MTTRRSFIKSTTTATAAVGLAASMPAAMTACAPKIVRCGLIGAKGMGFADLKAFLGQPDTECVAI